MTQTIAYRIRTADRGKVNVSFIYPPIPDRRFDWCASFDNDEPDDEGHMLVGFGKTKGDAIDDLLDNFEARTR